jgi:hypothetical protein
MTTLADVGNDMNIKLKENVPRPTRTKKASARRISVSVGTPDASARAEKMENDKRRTNAALVSPINAAAAASKIKKNTSNQDGDDGAVRVKKVIPASTNILNRARAIRRRRRQKVERRTAESIRTPEKIYTHIFD